MERIRNEVERRLAKTAGGQGLLLAEITAAWPGVVGDAIARNAWPLRLGRDGALHVATSSATWAFELDRMSPQIAERLAANLGDAAPSALRFRAGPVPEPGAATAVDTSEKTLETTPEVAAAAASAAATIDDPELRELVSRAARASLGKPRSDRGF
jgi:hypothetical protein